MDTLLVFGPRKKKKKEHLNILTTNHLKFLVKIFLQKKIPGSADLQVRSSELAKKSKIKNN